MKIPPYTILDYVISTLVWIIIILSLFTFWRLMMEVMPIILESIS